MGREVYATPRLPRGSSWTPGMPNDRLRIFPASPIVRGPMRPDLVLLDLIMPGMDGVETFRKLQEIQPDLPVLITTGYAEPGAVQSLADEGVAGFVNKPFAIESLAKRLEQILG